MELDFNIPVQDCSATSINLEHVACESDNVTLKITAKKGCYRPTATKIYEVKAVTFSFATKKFIDSGDHYLAHDWILPWKAKMTW